MLEFFPSYPSYGLSLIVFYFNSPLGQVNSPPLGFSLSLDSLYPSIPPNIGRPKTNFFFRFTKHTDLSVHTATIDSESLMKTESLPTQKSSMKLLPRLTHGFVNPHNPMLTQKSSTKLLPWLMHGFVNAHVPLLTYKSSMKTVSLPIQKSSATVESFLALLFFVVCLHDLGQHKTKVIIIIVFKT